MKKILKGSIILFVIISCLFLTACSEDVKKNKDEKLTGNDLIAYNMMLEVCYAAKDPTKVKVISGTVGSTIGAFKVSYDNGKSTYNVLITEENGMYTVEKMHDSLVSSYSDLLYNTDSFSMNKVNKALEKKWNS